MALGGWGIRQCTETRMREGWWAWMDLNHRPPSLMPGTLSSELQARPMNDMALRGGFATLRVVTRRVKPPTFVVRVFTFHDALPTELSDHLCKERNAGATDGTLPWSGLPARSRFGEGRIPPSLDVLTMAREPLLHTGQPP